MLYYKCKTNGGNMKVHKKFIKVTRQDGLIQVTDYKNNTYFHSHSDSVIFNISDVACLLDSTKIVISKGVNKIQIELTPDGFSKIEKIIFEE
jgi:hypothetical protein